jgi:hypothetical protein
MTVGDILFSRRADISKGWDGSYRGLDLPAGTYIYLVQGMLYDKKLVRKRNCYFNTINE